MTPTDAKLQVLISTHKPEGLTRVAAMTLPPVDGVAYLVSCQSEPQPLPDALRRDDVQVVFTPATGISNNRNNALDHATAPYALMADDDLNFHAQGLSSLIEALDAHPEVEIAMVMHEGLQPKVYPPTEHDLAVPYKNYHYNAIDIAVRVKAVRDRGLRFNPLISFGAPYLQCGEEGLFMLAAERLGMNRRFFPIVVSSHMHHSTADKAPTAGTVRAEGALISLRYGATKIPRLLLKAKRTRGNFFRNLLWLCQGAAYAWWHSRELL